jgi:hypothetical protein
MEQSPLREFHTLGTLILHHVFFEAKFGRAFLTSLSELTHLAPKSSGLCSGSEGRQLAPEAGASLEAAPQQ